LREVVPGIQFEKETTHARLGVDVDGMLNQNQNRLTTVFIRLHIYNRDDDACDVSRVAHHPPLEIRSVF
jgi:hypothetical protein